VAQSAQQALGVAELQVCADRGYYNAAQIKECEDAKIEVYMERPRPRQIAGIFPLEMFAYDGNKDEYECPAGQRLRFRVLDKAKQVRCYWTDVCQRCPLKSQCTTGKGPRKVKRPVGQEAADRMLARVQQRPDLLKLRKELVEHPFGTIKRWMRQDHFLTRGREKVSGESSLTFLAYNLKRAISLVGVEKLIAGLGELKAKTLLPVN
jgi:hypothetical protein